MSIHQDRLNEIKARRAAAYKGEVWYYSPINEDVCYLDNNMDEMAIADVRTQEAGEFIASAPADIDALIDHIERLTLDLEEANEIRSAIDGEYSHAFEVYYDIQDRYAKKRAALKKPA